MTLDQRLRDDLRTAADGLADDRADVTHVIRAGRRRRIVAPATAAVGALVAVAVIVSLIGPTGDSSQTAGLPATDDATLNAAIADPGNLVLLLCDGRYCLADDDGHEELQQLLADDPEVDAYYYVSEEQAAERVKDLYRAEPENMTASFVVVLAEGVDREEVAERYREAPGVLSWSSPEELAAAEETDDPLYARPDPDLVIFLCDGRTCPAITDAQLRDLRSALETDPDLLEARLETSEEAYDRFVDQFADEPELVESLDPDSLPGSFRVTARADADGEVLTERYGAFGGVEDAVWQRELRDARSDRDGRRGLHGSGDAQLGPAAPVFGHSASRNSSRLPKQSSA